MSDGRSRASRLPTCPNHGIWGQGVGRHPPPAALQKGLRFAQRRPKKTPVPGKHARPARRFAMRPSPTMPPRSSIRRCVCHHGKSRPLRYRPERPPTTLRWTKPRCGSRRWTSCRPRRNRPVFVLLPRRTMQAVHRRRRGSRGRIRSSICTRVTTTSRKISSRTTACVYAHVSGLVPSTRSTHGPSRLPYR